MNQKSKFEAAVNEPKTGKDKKQYIYGWRKWVIEIIEDLQCNQHQLTNASKNFFTNNNERLKTIIWPQISKVQFVCVI